MPSPAGRSTAAALAVALATIGACGIHPAAVRPSGEGRVVTAQAIERSHARDALEALERLALSLRIVQGGGGVSIQMRGQSGTTSAGECLVVLNAAALSQAGFLRSIPAAEVASIRILTPAEAMPRYGAPGGGGVIEVTTRAPDRQE